MKMHDPESLDAAPLPPSLAEEDFFFGAMALRVGLVTTDELLAVLNQWAPTKSQPLGVLLVARGVLAPNEHALVMALVAQLFERHDGRNAAGENAVREILPDLMSRAEPVGDETLTLVVPPASTSPGGSRSETAPATPSAEGRYTVLRAHAQGGLGKISIALDQELGREVAFKELRDKYADHLDYRNRFIIEAEITGGLEHPGVVPVYGLGHHADGRPYYAMRFVRGESLLAAIDAYHRTRKDETDPTQAALAMRQLLSRFIDVCHAMHYAHHRGVLHRDLKPENIMLGPYGETLIVDWGLAKTQERRPHSSSAFESALQPRHTTGSSATRLGSAVGTPAYMSPEQASGRLDDLGPTTDIYSLGATLYHLLTGQPPYTDATAQEIMARVQRGDRRPPRQLVPETPRALEAICLKAMAVDPALRYPSAAALLLDVERYLADEPVSAYAEPALIRMGRWLRKHRTAVSVVVATTFVAAIGFAVATMVVNYWRQQAVELADANKRLANQERQARQQAVERLRDARSAVDMWLTGTSDLAMPFGQGQWMTAAGKHVQLRLLQQAAADYERFAEQDSSDFDLQLERGRAYLRLGDVRRLLNQPDTVRVAYTKAVELLSSLHSQHQNEFDATLELANAHTRIGLLEAGANATERAEQAYRAALELLQPLAKDQPNQPRLNDALATVLFNRGVLLRSRADYPGAEKSIEAALAHFHRGVPSGERAVRWRMATASANAVRADLALRAGQHAVAVSYAQQAVQCVAPQTGSDVFDVDMTRLRADVQLFLASTLRPLGRYTDERQAYDAALAELESLCRQLPDVPGFMTARARTQLDYGQLLYQWGDCPAAKKMLEPALPWLERVAAELPDEPEAQQLLAASYDVLGETLRDLGEADAARRMHARAGDLLGRLAKEFAEIREYRHREAINRSYFGQASAALQADADAHAAFAAADQRLAELIRQAMAAGPTAAGELSQYHHARALVRMHRGALYWRRRDAANAEQWFAQALADARSAVAAPSPSPQYTHDLAWFLCKCPVVKLRNAPEALRLAESASKQVPANGLFQGTLGVAQLLAGQNKLAVATLQRAIEARAPGDPRDWLYLALARSQLGERPAAEQSWKTALERLTSLRPGSMELQSIRDELEPLVLKPR